MPNPGLEASLSFNPFNGPSFFQVRVGLSKASLGVFLCNFWWLTRPGKHTQSYGKSQSLIGKSTINYQRVYVIVGSEKNLLK